MKVILIGYRACGKSTVGMLLAARMKIPFRDVDALIEDSLGMSIREIIADRGWEYFRDKEKESIRVMEQKGACVIATGGGAILDPQNVELLKKLGVMVWLNAPLQDIIERLNQDAQEEAIRPQFTTGNLEQETIAVLRERLILYERAADYIVATAGKSAPQVAEDIYQYLLESGNLAKINKSRNKAVNKASALSGG